EERAEVAQLAHDLGLLQEGVEVAHDVEAAVLAGRDVLERLERVVDVALALAAEDGLEALGDRPDLEPHLAVARQILDELLDALLLEGDDVDERVTGLDQVLQLPLTRDSFGDVH